MRVWIGSRCALLAAPGARREGPDIASLSIATPAIFPAAQPSLPLPSPLPPGATRPFLPRARRPEIPWPGTRRRTWQAHSKDLGQADGRPSARVYRRKRPRSELRAIAVAPLLRCDMETSAVGMRNTPTCHAALPTCLQTYIVRPTYGAATDRRQGLDSSMVSCRKSGSPALARSLVAAHRVAGRQSNAVVARWASVQDWKLCAHVRRYL